MDLVPKECASQTAGLVVSVALFVASEAIGLYKGTSRTGLVDIVIGVLSKLKSRPRPGTPTGTPTETPLETPGTTVAV